MERSLNFWVKNFGKKFFLEWYYGCRLRLILSREVGAGNLHSGVGGVSFSR